MGKKIQNISNDEIQDIFERYRSESIMSLATEHDVSESYLRKRFRKLGLRKIDSTKINQENNDTENMIAMYLSGKSYKQIADELGYRSAMSIHKIIRSKLGDEARNPGAPYQYSCNDEFFEVIDTEEKAYWIGFLAADGNIYGNNKIVRIKLQGIDKNHLMKFKYNISSNHPIYEYEDDGYKCGFSCSIHVQSPKMCQDLARYSIIPNKTLTVRLPELRDLTPHLIRGYIDGDGGIYIRDNGQAALSISGNEYNIDFISGWLFKQGMDVSIRKKNGCNEICTEGNIKVPEILDLFYQEPKIYLDRKHSIYQSIKEVTK